MNKKTIMFAGIAIVLPFMAFAADLGDADKLFSQLSDWLGVIGQLIIAATVVAIFWGLFMFIFNEDKKDEGKRMMTWGILALFIMVSIWGIISFLQASTGTADKGAIGIDNLVPKVK